MACSTFPSSLPLALATSAVLFAGCGGGGGEAAAPASPLPSPVPQTIEVGETSYHKFKGIGLAPQQLPIHPYLSLARTYGDFAKRGQYDLFVATIDYDVRDSATYTRKGRFLFYARQADGSFVENRSLLSDSTGCLHPRKALTIDVNKDGRPDVVVACTGLDTAPFPGEQQAVIVSQPDGTYRTTFLPFSSYSHGAAAGDLDGDGYPDVVMTDAYYASAPYFVLINNRDGTFTRRSDLLPAGMAGKLIYTVEVVDLNDDGKLDVFFAGSDQTNSGPCTCTTPPFVLLGNETGNYSSASSIQFPTVPNEGTTLDAIFTPDAVYLLRTSEGDGTSYMSTVVQKIAMPSLTSSVIYSSRQQRIPSEPWTTWTNWILPYEGNIVSDAAALPLSVGI